MSINIDQVTKLTEELSQGLKLLTDGNDKARLRLTQVAYKISQALENPQETFWRLWMLDVRTEAIKHSFQTARANEISHQSITRSVVQVASDLNLPEQLPNEPNKAVGSVELEKKTGAEQALLSE